MTQLVKTFRNHWKKTTFGACLLTWGGHWLYGKHCDNLLRRAACEEAQVIPFNVIKLNPAFLISVVQYFSHRLFQGLWLDTVSYITGVGVTFSKIPIGFIPLGQTCSLSNTLFPESGNKVQHITDATLAIVKGETIPLDVLQIKGEKEQPVFALSGLRWGSYRDAGVKVSKYWYLGPLKTKAAHFFSTLKEWPQIHQASISYVGPTERPPSEPEEKPPRPALYRRIFRRLASYWTRPQDAVSQKVKPEVWKEVQLSTLELSITTRNSRPDLTGTEDFMNICIEPDTVSKSDFISIGSQKMRDPHMCPEGSEYLQASRCTLLLPERTGGSFSIDSEEYEAMGVEVTLLPKKLQFFCDPRQREKMLQVPVQ
uniref:Acylglycerol kinase, mitochondrial n=2 Tax=Vombatus ursinus TaxID=29139 RepID=A0A4X2LAZ4_VOMUR